MSRKKYENAQSDLLSFLPEACFFLSLLSVADDYNEDFGTGKTVDLIGAWREALDRGWLGRADSIMYNDIALLRWLTGARVTKEVLSPTSDVSVAENEYTITKYELAGKNHFRRRGYDVWRDSQTVRNGRLVAVYLYRLSDA